MPYSHHSHSGQFCKHAAGTLEDVVLEAIRQGFHTYGLTEHVPRYRTDDLYPEEAGLTPTDLHTQFIAFLSEAHRLKTKYASQITLLVGAESEYITSADLVGLDSLLNVHGDRIEYLVGSVHHVGGIPIDFDLPTFDRAIDSFSGVPSGPSTSLFTTHVNSSDPDASSTAADNTKTTAFLNAYLDAQYTLLTRFHPEIIGHFDLCRLYTPYLLLSSYPYSLERVRRNVEYAVSYGALFELNAAAFRKGWDAAYPGEDIVDIIKAAGGRFALSDDSHGPHAVGLNYHRLLEYARRVGIDELWHLSPSGPDTNTESAESAKKGGRRLAATKVEGRWWDDVFWSHIDCTSGAQ